jgi:TPR repeat protein
VPGLPQDAARAYAWFSRAAAAHHASAAYYLGIMSRDGQGVRPDPEAAARWLGVAESRRYSLDSEHALERPVAE